MCLIKNSINYYFFIKPKSKARIIVQSKKQYFVFVMEVKYKEKWFKKT